MNSAYLIGGVVVFFVLFWKLIHSAQADDKKRKAIKPKVSEY